MATATAGSPAAADARSGEALTFRRDAWWVFPLVTLVVYTAFIVYATFRFMEPVLREGSNFAAYAGYYLADNGSYHYASPFGTPDLTFLVPAFLHNVPFLGQLVRSPAFIILPFPAGFRFTCY